MRRIIIIGASYLQVPLIKKAKEMNIETHVFAWEDGAIGKKFCDYFYPISIIEKEEILKVAEKLKPNAVISIASDLAIITVNYLANELGLIGNSDFCTKVTTNKYKMRQVLSVNDLLCPKFVGTNDLSLIDLKELNFPLIIKPVDRSGSRGISIIYSLEELKGAFNRAFYESFSKEIIIEEFIKGKEISVEMISWKGEHYYLTCTDKETTGSPYFGRKNY